MQAAWRIGSTIVTTVAVQTMVCGAAVLPVIAIWTLLASSPGWSLTLRVVALGMVLIPSYVLFALLLMFVSALTTRALGWRTPADLTTRISDLEWPLLHWVRYMVSIHVVRFFAGGLFRGSPVWTAYLRLAGARLGRHVYVNSLAVNDYNLLDFEDGVVIGDDVHLSGHTVERGILRTGRVRLGRNVTIGVGSVVEIDVEAGDGCQVGALAVVPKHTKLAAGGTYVGIPARRIASSLSVDAASRLE
jgi:acetyltransferase-like isoleucine patch superfamily enzyme